MELATMLSGERFSDRPATVCPIVGAILRAYNDDLDDGRRQELYRYAAEALDTRGGFALQRQRAEAALEWARKVKQGESERGWRAWRRPPDEPDPDSGPDQIARYVIDSLRRYGGRGLRAKRWSEASRTEMIELLDRLIEIGNEGALESLVGEFVEDPGQPVEDLSQPVEQSEPPVVPRAEAVHEHQPVHDHHWGETIEHLPDPDGTAVAGATFSAPMHLSRGGYRTLERSAQLLGGIIVVGAALHASRRRRQRVPRLAQHAAW